MARNGKPEYIQQDSLFFEDFDEEDGLMAIGRPPVHTPEMTGLIALLDDEYKRIEGINFGYIITPGMYTYFGSMIAWARLLKVYMMNQYGYDDWMKRFVEVVEYGNFAVPSLLGEYIRGIGNFTLPFGRTIKLKLPDLHLCTAASGHGGYFGKIEDHVELYAQLISPGVLVDRIMKDLGTPGHWDLPDDIRMNDHGINANCLGYAPAKRPSAAVLETYANLRITNDTFPAPFSEFCYYPDLMAVVMNVLRANRKLELKPINSQTPYGSIGQLMTIETRETDLKTSSERLLRRGTAPICENFTELHADFSYRRRIIKNRTLMPNNFDSDDEITEAYFNQFERFHADDDAIVGLDSCKGRDFLPEQESRICLASYFR